MDDESRLVAYQKAKYIKENMFGRTFHLHFHILENLANTFEKDDLTYVEIGTFEGGSLSLMMQNKKIKNLISIDPLCIAGQEENLKKNTVKFNIHGSNVQHIKRYSYDEAIFPILDTLPNGIDILFIDGDHQYQPVINDFNLYYKYVNKGGYIVFDDYQDYRWSPQVMPAVNKIVADIQAGKYSPYKFEVIGCYPNNTGEVVSNIPVHGDMNNEFILKVVDK